MIRFIPNILTFTRLVLTVVFLVMILCSPGVENKSVFLTVAFVLFVIAGLTDIIDGKVARKYNVTSKFGRIMDPLVDKVLVCGAFVSLAIIGEPILFNLNEPLLNLIHWSVAAIVIGRDAYVTILRHVAERQGIDFGAVLSGKLKMFLHLFAIGTVTVKMAHVPTALWGSWFTAVTFVIMLILTLISGLTYQIRWQRCKSLGKT